MSYDEKYMRMAIELAKCGAGAVNPNPLVGAVIVKDDRVIGKGFHARYGGLHAERAAIESLTENADGAEMYVTLEPCCHTGKQPPCTHAIVEQKISKVYVGSDDPNRLVSGKGMEYLRQHGVEVVPHILENECDDLNQVFFHYITEQTPYVVMKYAMTMDGKICSQTGDSRWVSGEQSRQRVQESRNLYAGIMVGINTVLVDDPMLTCRIEHGRNPIRIICDSKLRIPGESNIVKTANEIRTIVATCVDSVEQEKKIDALQSKGVEILHVGNSDKRVDLKLLMTKLGEMGIDGILLEGGGTLNYSAVSSGIVSEVQVYLAPKIVGGRAALTPVEGVGVQSMSLAKKFKLHKLQTIGEDVLLVYRRDKHADVLLEE